MIIEAINELKKYTLGKKNTEKIEVSVINLNRIIFALEEPEPVFDKIRAEIAEEAKCTMNEDRAGELYKALQIFDTYNSRKRGDSMKEELTTYQIYLILLGYLTERNDDTEMLKSMLIELYKRADKTDKEESEIQA